MASNVNSVLVCKGRPVPLMNFIYVKLVLSTPKSCKYKRDHDDRDKARAKCFTVNSGVTGTCDAMNANSTFTALNSCGNQANLRSLAVSGDIFLIYLLTNQLFGGSLFKLKNLFETALGPKNQKLIFKVTSIFRVVFVTSKNISRKVLTKVVNEH